MWLATGHHVSPVSRDPQPKSQYEGSARRDSLHQRSKQTKQAMMLGLTSRARGQAWRVAPSEPSRPQETIVSGVIRIIASPRSPAVSAASTASARP